MSSSLNRIRKNIIEAMQSANKQGTSAYDSVAEVRRVEGDTAWVHIAGGVDETPVKLTIAAKAGDMVQVRVGGGRAWITGNASAPPTDDKTAIVAKSLANIAGNRAKTAQKTADQAQIVADSALEGTKENAAQMAQMVIDFNGDIENLQDQIDGNISTWFYDVDPAMDLPPVTDWDTDEKKNTHLGDIYYNTVKGYAWRFMKSGSTYSWERITDTDVTKALADAAKAQDTADSKRRVFYNTPTVPYDAGDLWVQGSSGDILRCAQAKTSTDSYDRNDWVLASKYTDDTTAEQAKKDAADAATSATDYISPQSVSSADDGIKVFPKSEKDNPKNYININSSSTDIYKNGKKIAQYSQGIIINDDDGNKVFSAELMNGKYINEHDSLGIHKKISAGVTTTLSFDLTAAPSGDIEGTIPVSNSFGELLGIMNVYSFIEAPQELSIPSEYGTGSVLVNSISYTNKTVTVSITNNTNIEIDFGTSAEYADHMIWSYYMRDYGVATRCGGFWENDYTKAFAIGVGKDTNNRKNAFAVDWDGNVAVNGNLVVQGDNLVSKIQNMLCAAYPETLTVKNGTFTNDGSNASLVGNSLYLHINAKANAAITAGNITNQTMLTITFTDDRILTLYSVSGSGGSSGPNSQMLFTGASSGGQHTITVTLAAIAQNIAKGGVINAKVSIPCVLNWDAY